MTTEITDTTTATGGWLLYDGNCTVCTRSARKIEGCLNRRGYRIAPLQTDWVEQRFDRSFENPEEMLVIQTDGTVLAGIDAFGFAASHHPLGFWIAPALHVPGLHWIGVRIYEAIAARRQCINGACEVHEHRTRTGTGWLATLAIAIIWLYEGLWLKLIVGDALQLSVVNTAMRGFNALRMMQIIGAVEVGIALAVLIAGHRRWIAYGQALFLLGMNVAGTWLAATEIGDVTEMWIRNLPLYALILALPHLTQGRHS